MTYAAGLKAVTIVWIADKFTEEHRAALDWLNEITDDRFNFFGLEIELWQIGESPVAPKFNVVCKPNDWSKTISGAASRIEEGELSETKLLQQEYWEALRKELLDHKSIVKPQKPLPQHWTNFAIGRAYFHLSALVNTVDERIAISLVMTGPYAKPHFRLLKEDQAIIESEMGVPLEWEELPDKKESRVILRFHGVDPTDRQQWTKQHQWFREKLESFHKVFSRRIKQLNADEGETEEVG